MLSLTISAYAAVILICNIFLGLRRGMLRSVVRLVMLLLTVPLAVWLTQLIAGVIGSSIAPLVQSSLQGADSQLIRAILSVGDSLDALVTMAVAASMFGGIYALTGLIVKLADKPLAALLEKRWKPKASSRLMGALVGILCGAVLIVATLCPFTGMLPVADSVVALSEDHDQPWMAEVQEAVQNPVNRAISLLGGDAIFSAVTTVDYRGESIDLVREATAFADVVAGYGILSREDAALWDAADAAMLERAADSFDDSRVTADVVATLLCDITGCWKDGQPYLGLPCPDAGELLNPSLHTLCEVLSDSTGSSVRQNVHTVAHLIGALIEYDMLSSERVAQSPDALTYILRMFSNQAFTAEAVSALYDDPQLRPLIPEFLNLGIRAMAHAMDIPESYSALYEQTMQRCSSAFNATLGENDVARMVKLGDALYDILNDSGVGISPSVASALAMGMVADFDAYEQVTPVQIQAWFASYAESAATAAIQIAGTANDKTVQPLGLAEGEPSVMLLGDTDAVFMPGAYAAAAYIAAQEEGSIPYQMLTVAHIASGDIYTVVSLQDGSLRCFDFYGNEHEAGVLRGCQIAVLVGGEFSVIKYSAEWQILDGPRRIDCDTLAHLSDTLLADLSPLPEGYLPTSGGNTTSASLKNAQNQEYPITRVDDLLGALNGAVNHERARGSYGAGTAASMGSADTFKTYAPCVESMLLSDLRALSDAMSREGADSVAATMSQMAAYMEKLQSGALAQTGSIGTQEIGTVLAMLNALSDLSGDSAASVDMLLAVVGDLGGDVYELRAFLEANRDAVTQLAEQLLGTAGTLSAVADQIPHAELTELLKSLLISLDADGAHVMAAAISPKMLTLLGVAEQATTPLAAMMRDVFEMLAQAKSNGLTEQEFDREAAALATILLLGMRADQVSESGAWFGESGVLGMDAMALLDSVLASDSVSSALIHTVSGTGGAYFTVTNLNPLMLSLPDGADRDQLYAALDRAEAGLLRLTPSHGELWSPQNRQVTQQDVARRLVVFAALFGVEYSTAYADIPQR